MQNKTIFPITVQSARSQEGRRLPHPSAALWDTEQGAQTTPHPGEGAEAPTAPWDDEGTHNGAQPQNK